MPLRLNRRAPLFPAASRQAGFSLIELLVSVVIMAEILVGVAILFDSSNRLARSQTHVAELQQSLRVGQSEVVRFARMAGIGGLPITRLQVAVRDGAGSPLPVDYDTLGTFPRGGYAVSLINDVAAGTTFTTTGGGSVQVLAGSDVLILRGVFTTPLFYLGNELDISTWPKDAAGELTAGAATLPIDDRDVVIPNRVRNVGQFWEDYPQDIDALGARLVAALAAATPAHQKVALILRDTLNPNAYLIAELDGDTDPGVAGLTPDPCPSPSPAFPDETCDRSLRFKLRLEITPGSPGEAYAKLITGTGLQLAPADRQARGDGLRLRLPAGTDPASPGDVVIELPTTIGSIGLLEEYRFFVRVENEVPGDASTRLIPVLSRARFLPGTDEMVDRVDIADNVIDLQLAVGADSDLPGTAGYGVIAENQTAGYVADEVLFNEAGDTSLGSYTAPPGAALTWYDPDLTYHFLRINTLVQSRVPDTKIQAPALDDIEDFNRGATITIGSTTYNDETQYHRRWLQTVVELRNLL